MRLLLFILALSFSFNGFSKSHKLFLAKKNFNPNNILHFDANLNDQCQFDLNNPLHIYWILGNDPKKHAPSWPESSYVQSNFSIKTEDKVVFSNYAVEKVGDFLRGGLIARSEMLDDGTCNAYVEADTSEYGIIKINTLYGELKTFFGVPYSLKHFVISGLDEHGQSFSKKINKSIEK